MFERQEERLSLSPCGDEVWRGEVPSLGKEGRVVVKREAKENRYKLDPG